MTNGKINYPLMSAVRHIVVQAVARPCSQIRAVRASLAVRLAVADTLCPCHVPVPRTVVPPCGLKVAPLLVYANWRPHGHRRATRCSNASSYPLVVVEVLDVEVYIFWSRDAEPA